MKNTHLHHRIFSIFFHYNHNLRILSFKIMIFIISRVPIFAAMRFVNFAETLAKFFGCKYTQIVIYYLELVPPLQLRSTSIVIKMAIKNAWRVPMSFMSCMISSHLIPSCTKLFACNVTARLSCQKQSYPLYPKIPMWVYYTYMLGNLCL